METCERVGDAVDSRLWLAGLMSRQPAAAASKNPFYLGADISSLAQVEARGGGPDANSLFDAKGSPLPAMDVLGAGKGTR